MSFIWRSTYGANWADWHTHLFNRAHWGSIYPLKLIDSVEFQMERSPFNPLSLFLSPSCLYHPNMYIYFSFSTSPCILLLCVPLLFPPFIPSHSLKINIDYYFLRVMSSLQHREKRGSMAVFYFTSSSYLLCRSYYLSVRKNSKRREKKDAREMRMRRRRERKTYNLMQPILISFINGGEESVCVRITH